MVLVIVFLSLLVWIPELPGMLHRKNPREIALFAALWAAGLALWLAVNAGIPTNQITVFLRAIFEPIGKALIVPAPQ